MTDIDYGVGGRGTLVTLRHSDPSTHILATFGCGAGIYPLFIILGGKHCVRDLPSSEDEYFLSLLHVLYKLQSLKHNEREIYRLQL